MIDVVSKLSIVKCVGVLCQHVILNLYWIVHGVQVVALAVKSLTGAMLMSVVGPDEYHVHNSIPQIGQIR